MTPTHATFGPPSMTTRLLALLLILSPAPALADRYSDAVASPSRPEADIARDGLRQPETVLRAIGVEEGLTVLDVGAGGGYYSEMFSYLVGESGEVIMQNPSQLYEIFPNLHGAISGQRLAEGRLPNVRLIETETTELGLPDASVDLVFFHLIYHDMFWLYPEQIETVNAEIRRVLNPGGRLVIIDHDSVEGAKASESMSRQGVAHRLEDDYVQSMMAQAGFELVASSEALRVTHDPRTEPFFDESLQGKPTDRFFHIYRK